MQPEDFKLDLAPANPLPETAAAQGGTITAAQNLGAASADVQPSSEVKISEELVSTAQAATEINARPAWAEPVPDVATLTAAKDAAAFVAQIFTDPSISDTADADVTPAQQPEAAPAEQLAPVPAQWPQGQGQHLQGQRVLILGLGASGMATYLISTTN